MQDAPRTTSARKAAQKFTVARGLIALLCAGLVGALGVWFDKEGFALVDTFDKHAGDIPIAYGSRTATGQRSDIAVILINEDTIAGYETRSPLDRRLIADRKSVV